VISRALTPAERQRRRRERVREGRLRIVVEIDGALIEDALQRAGILSPADADDPQKVDAALCEAVRAWAKTTIAAALAESMSRVTPSVPDSCDRDEMQRKR
jgi:hypothetical protein